ncbi:hypothetical protein M407DRAFT_245149 [Tulasnella calospora MUT 4182]|uniref:Uncharacterized protein n=1 Tax=Tulasnella calospora MUT 4182 TaxID=1051891 RepID=A0A0C3LME0_9AGAM|nr:hypothetical protein M407DRAFT_245149 [Tulasnella calospora MUT 4182]
MPIWKQAFWDYMVYRRAILSLLGTPTSSSCSFGRPDTRARACQSPYDASPMPRSLLWHVDNIGARFAVGGTGVALTV